MNRNLAHIASGSYALADHPLLGVGEGLAAKLAQAELERAQLALKSILKTMERNPSLAALGGQLLEQDRLLKQGEARAGKEFLETLALSCAAEALGVEEEKLSAAFDTRPSLIPQPLILPPQPKASNSPPLEALWRRQLHDAFIHGLAIDHMCRAIVLVRERLEEASPGLFASSVAFADLCQLSHFKAPPPPRGALIPLAGFSRVYWVQGKPRAEALATHFPILVQEISKAALELAFAHGLDDNHCREVLAATSRKEDEVWHFMIGPELARRSARSLFASEGVLGGCMRLAKLDWPQLQQAVLQALDT